MHATMVATTAMCGVALSASTAGGLSNRLRRQPLPTARARRDPVPTAGVASSLVVARGRSRRQCCVGGGGSGGGVDAISVGAARGRCDVSAAAAVGGAAWRKGGGLARGRGAAVVVRAGGDGGDGGKGDGERPSAPPPRPPTPPPRKPINPKRIASPRFSSEAQTWALLGGVASTLTIVVALFVMVGRCKLNPT